MADHNLKGEENVEHFLGHLYTDICTEARWSVELPDIIDATKEMVKRIVAEAYGPNMEELKSEGVTNIDIVDVGSMAEGTKVCDPDELDFAISFTYSSNTLKILPPSNEKNISFLKYTAVPKDPRFFQIYLGKNKKELLPSITFMERNCEWLERALFKVSKEGPIYRGKNCLYLDVKSDSKKIPYGMQGPAFHLHKLVKWFSPKHDDFSISVDLVPTIVIYDEHFADKLPDCLQGCLCEEHLIHKPDHFLLVPIKSREIATTHLYRIESNDQWEAKTEFAMRYFMVSLSEYESDVIKTWKCEKSMYRNWFICYKIMKCFGDLDHISDIIALFYRTKGMRYYVSSITIPERNESFTSYTWKTLVCEMASQETSKLTLKQCFDRLTAIFEEENLEKSKDVTVHSFWLPSEIPEKIHLNMRNSQDYTPYVNRMIQLKAMLNEIVYDSSYNYPRYKEKIKKMFPKLSSYFCGNGNVPNSKL